MYLDFNKTILEMKDAENNINVILNDILNKAKRFDYCKFHVYLSSSKGRSIDFVVDNNLNVKGLARIKGLLLEAMYDDNGFFDVYFHKASDDEVFDCYKSFITHYRNPMFGKIEWDEFKQMRSDFGKRPYDVQTIEDINY